VWTTYTAVFPQRRGRLRPGGRQVDCPAPLRRYFQRVDKMKPTMIRLKPAAMFQLPQAPTG
jgi:hypothetical protein